MALLIPDGAGEWGVGVGVHIYSNHIMQRGKKKIKSVKQK